MNFHVYVENELQKDIEAICAATGKKRNTIVREALHEYVQRHGRKKWSEAILNYTPPDGIDSFPRFEDYRNDGSLGPMNEDPLGLDCNENDV